MKNKNPYRNAVPQDLTFLLNFLQLNNLRFDKHFNTLLDILYHEKWEEMPRMAIATRECLKYVLKMEKNLEEIRGILHQAGYQN
ncbi:MAG: hypothetical protein MJA30_26225 [Cytophagales bacterium]|nr:hypothetical protein [Cytophagales bacterium]